MMGIIEFEETPNPNALRILPGRKLTKGPPLEFARENADEHPVATELFAIDGIVRVMVARDFVTVVREDASVSWDELRPEIVLALTDAMHAPMPDAPVRAAPDKPLGPVEQHIEEVLDRHVRPYLAADGGDAVLVRFDPEDGVAWVRMEGACGGCPSGVITLKRGIEQAICRWVPEVKQVKSDDVARDNNEDPKARFRKWLQTKWGKQSKGTAKQEDRVAS